MQYIEKWFHSLLEGALNTLENEVQACGICKKHTGPMYFYAIVEIKLEPAKEIQFVDILSEEKRHKMLIEDWYDEVLYGVMDILLIRTIGKFKLTILDVDFTDIESRKIAFRWAARNAVLECLEKLEKTRFVRC